jgi:hypothetical protein
MQRYRTNSRRRAAPPSHLPEGRTPADATRPSNQSPSTKATETIQDLHPVHGLGVASTNHPTNLVPSSELHEQSGPIRPVAIPVPKSQRRGFFAKLAILAEIEDPYQYPTKTKWFIVFLAAYLAAAAPLGSAIFFRTHLSCLVEIIFRD